jgi:hypothetical protein
MKRSNKNMITKNYIIIIIIKILFKIVLKS